jgi:L-serine dehydratase
MNIWRVMRECVQRGLQPGGTLPGPFKVKRRAPLLAAHCASVPSAPWPTR